MAEQAIVTGWQLSGRAARRFAVAFLTVAATLLAIYYFPHAADGAIARALAAFLHGYTAVAGAILRIFDRGLVVAGDSISGRYSLRLVKTCDAMDVTILLVSAVLAWPGRWRRRVAAAAMGIAFVFVINVVRICSLYFVGLHLPQHFELIHLELWPLLILLAVVAAFLFLVRWMGRPDAGRPS
jgi:exosortase/archaeosortase family protein